jgi:hypothetical protein
MKHIINGILTSILITQILYASEFDQFNVILEPYWKDLEQEEKKELDFGGKWILAGSITFKKKAKDTVYLNHIYLHWRGKKIDHLMGSLYRKESDRKFLPIQENLVCDGLWNKSQQTLMLNFERKHNLGPINTFYLVLTVPQNLEPVLKRGSFNLMAANLPEQFKVCANKQSLTMASAKQPNYYRPTYLSFAP